ncbi:MAG TPA: FliH/SctL family protein [Solirubrobacteraceae bacterium]|jgi:flagellar assembly protein FliH|nr:FliH/SctL family protein [Solirubrobacteraceae bacterium]
MAAAEFSFEALEAAPVTVAAPVARSEPDAALAEHAVARAEIEALREAAREEGLREGREEALAALVPALEALNAAAEAVRADALVRTDRLEAHAVDLGLFLAERVVGGAITVEPELVVEAVRGALRGIVERERITVLVHPEDLSLVAEAMDGLRATLGGIEHCEVQAERRVSRGGAVVRTPDGDVDARVETKLQRAREVVEAALGPAA